MFTMNLLIKKIKSFMKAFDLESFKKQIKPVGFVMLLSLIGFVVNFFPVGIFSSFQLVLGNVAFVIVAMRFGILYSLLAAFLVNIPLIDTLGHPFGFITYGLEAIIISFLRRNGWYVLYADMFYWLFIGMPLTAFIFFQYSDAPQHFWMLSTVKQAFNGLICCNLAGLLIYFFPKTFTLSYRHQPSVKRSFQDQIVYVTSHLIIFSIAMSSILISQNVTSLLYRNIEKNIHDSKSMVINMGDNFVDKHRVMMKSSAHALSREMILDEQSVKDNIDFIFKNYPTLNSIYVANTDGDIIASSVKPSSKFNNNYYINSSIKQQEYFEKSVSSSLFFQSKMLDHYIDNKGVAEPVIVFSQSFDYHGDGIIRGTVHATMDLSSLHKLIPNNLLQDVKYVITDVTDKTIFSSQGLNVQEYGRFQFTMKKNSTFDSTDLISIKNPDNKDEQTDYFLTQGKFLGGWNVYVLLGSERVLSVIEREYTFIFLLLFLCFSISISLAQKVSSQLTKPLSFVLRQIRFHGNEQGVKSKPLPTNSAKEIITLYNEVLQNKDKILKYQNNLENKVEQRTIELQKANDKLTQLAQKDGLTNIFNRRYFDDNFSFFQKLSFRNHNTLAVVMLDIDHFKRINDQHGHLSGDECLRVVSSVLSAEFCRETDLIARYGGEEFVLVISGISYENLSYKLEKLRKRIENKAIYGEESNLIHVTASLGAIIADASFALDSQDWIKVADLCLYKAKRSGRNMTIIENFTREEATKLINDLG